VTRTITTAAITAALFLLSVAGTAQAQTAGERAEANMIRAINDVRAKNGLYPLRGSSSLAGSAGRFSRWLMDNDHFGHLSAIRASSEFAMLGEALEWHSGHRFRVRAALGRWMGSAGHRAIVLTQAMRWVGTGVTRGRFGASRATIWVLQTGKLAPGVQLPGPALPLP
jgi:uncharacterized protein YkwD